MLVIKYISWLTTCAVFVAFLSILIHAYWASQNLTKLTTILTGLIALENSISITKTEAPRIAVGEYHIHEHFSKKKNLKISFMKCFYLPQKKSDLNSSVISSIIRSKSL